MATLVNIQHSLGRFEPGALAPFSAPPSASRNTDGSLAAHAVVSPVDVLAARFPVTHRLVGEESFRAMARRFVASEPPCMPTLDQYGEMFPRFLRRRGKTASIEYVADIAELEMARNKAHHAADAGPVAPQAFASLRPAKHNRVRILFHPSVFLVASRFPIVTIWRNNQTGGEGAMIDRWRTESALVARPFFGVEVRCLPPGGHVFISTLTDGHTIAAAGEAGMTVAPNFDIASNLAILAEANVVVALREDA